MLIRTTLAHKIHMHLILLRLETILRKIKDLSTIKAFMNSFKNNTSLNATKTTIELFLHKLSLCSVKESLVQLNIMFVRFPFLIPLLTLTLLFMFNLSLTHFCDTQNNLINKTMLAQIYLCYVILIITMHFYLAQNNMIYHKKSSKFILSHIFVKITCLTDLNILVKLFYSSKKKIVSITCL